MGEQNNDKAFSILGGIAIPPVLVLLYFGLLLRDWHYIEDIRAMVVPLVTFGLFSGILLSVVPVIRSAKRSWRVPFVFLVAALVASSAIALHICLINKVGFAPKSFEPGKVIPHWFYNIFALVSVFFFGCSAVCGFLTSIAFSESIMGKLHPESLTPKHNQELLIAGITATIGLLGTILAALLGGQGP
jgi:hypothetical protein